MFTFNRFMKKMLPAILAFVLIFGLFAPQVSKAADHTDNTSLNTMIEKTVDYYKNRNTTLNSWWDLVALWGAGQNLNDGSWKLPSWYKTDPKLSPTASGTLHINYIFGLLAMGEDPAHAWETNRNLYAELAAQQNASTGIISNFDKHIWAMLALDTGEKLGSSVGQWDAAAKKKAVDYVLSQQKADGGFGSVDTTGMTTLALGYYQNDSAVHNAIERVKDFLQAKKINDQYPNYSMFGNNSNTMSTAVTGLTAIGQDILSDSWTNNGKSILDSYALFQYTDGSFKWKETETAGNGVATNQALIALLDTKYQKTVWHRFADIRLPVRVSVEVDGISDRIYEENIVTVLQDTNAATALDALKNALDNATPAIPYNIVNSSYGPYVKGIGGQEAGTFGGWDGWMYEVNGVAPDVGAGDYRLKENDKIRFYYSRYPAIATTTTQIANGASNPVVEVTLTGDEFTSFANDSSNWSINTGSTGLLVGSIVKDNNKVTISFEGTAKGGAVTIAALGGALVGNQESDPISVAVPRIISDSVDQSFVIDENEAAVSIGSLSEAAVTNHVVLTFGSTNLPKITAARGNTTLGIPANTKVTSTWNKELLLPTNLSLDDSSLVTKMNTALLSDSKKVDTVAVRINVGGNEKIQFDQHVTLTLKGQGAKEAGFVDQTGTFTPIKKYADSTVRTDEVYAYNDNGDLIIKTKHFTSFLAYSTSAITSSGGGGSVPATQTVKLSVEKRSLGEGDIVAPVTLSIQAGDTAFTALKRALDDKGVALTYTGSDTSVYVQSIGGLAELEKGEGSGWMYSVNGVFPEISAGAYTLKNGDVLRWQYTKDLGKDIGGAAGSGGNIGTGEQLPGGDNGSTAVTYKDAAQISSWAKDAVAKASALGFMQGTSTAQAKFEPKRQLTRAEFAALMVKYSGIDPVNEDAGFKDVTSKDWFYGYVAAAKAKGLMSGKSDTSFAPNAPISREEVAAVLVRLTGLSDSNAPQAAIKDRDAVSAWAVPYVNVAYQNGLMTGDNGLFNPQSFVTREMAAVVIIRLYEMK